MFFEVRVDRKAIRVRPGVSARCVEQVLGRRGVLLHESAHREALLDLTLDTRPAYALGECAR
jgi:hypothetical protein